MRVGIDFERFIVSPTRCLLTVTTTALVLVAVIIIIIITNRFNFISHTLQKL